MLALSSVPASTASSDTQGTIYDPARRGTKRIEVL
jgi:hypothetical protein